MTPSNQTCATCGHLKSSHVIYESEIFERDREQMENDIINLMEIGIPLAVGFTFYNEYERRKKKRLGIK